VIKKPRTRGG